MRTLHLFAGAGGGLLADLILGHEPVCAVEWDAYCCEVLRERRDDGWFPGLEVWEGDVREFPAEEWQGRVDCVHAGFPCQPHSVAGKRRGADDDRNLWPATADVLRAIRPQWVLLENVPGIVFNGFVGTVLGDLAALGYDARWTVLGADDVGATHRRKRWWCLAYRSGAGLEERTVVGGDDGAQQQAVERDCGDDVADGPRHGWKQGRAESAREQGGHDAAERGGDVAYGSHYGHQGRQGGDSGWIDILPSEQSLLGREEGRSGELSRRCDIPLFPPAPDDAAGWERVLGRWPELAPAVAVGTSKRLEKQVMLSGHGVEQRQGHARVGEDMGAPEAPQPAVRGVADGLAHRVDRLKALGNGQVPLSAAAVWLMLGGPVA